MHVDHLIIGAGLAGTVVQHFLHNERTVLLDPNPGGYKIGESMAPEHYHHPELAALLPEIRKLPSFSTKMGTIFISADAVASFPLPPFAADHAMHGARHELEPLMHELWKTPIVRERVVQIDVAHKVVHTDQNSYEVDRQIIDCSGPSMVVARALDDVEELWPVYSRWAYYDITDIHHERFWRSLQESGKRYGSSSFYAPSGKLMNPEEEAEWEPSKTTILTEVEPGLWTWQIPMYNRTLLSFGVVSKKGKVSDAQLDDLVEHTRAAHYTLRRHAEDGTDYGKVHVRDHFAQRAKTPSTPDYILVADACAFADPVYSVGSALAVNKAIEVAAALNGGAWDEAASKRYNENYAALLGRAVHAFEFWYTRDLVNSAEAAAEVQRDYLQGGAFQNGVAIHYSQTIVDSCPDLQAEGRNDFFFEDESGQAPLRTRIAQLLGLNDTRMLAPWQLVGSGWVPKIGVALRWRREGMPTFDVQIGFDPNAVQYLRRIGPVTVSYMSLEDRPYPFDGTCDKLLDEISERIESTLPDWADLAASV